MRIGELRERVIIEKKNEVPDDVGGCAETWEEVGEVWAKVVPAWDRSISPTGWGGVAVGRELAMSAQRPVDVSRVIVIMRKRADLDVKTFVNRLRWRGKILEIKGVADYDLKRGFLGMVCEEVVI